MDNSLINYPSLGVVTNIFNNKKFIFRCGKIDERFSAGHYHNDQLSIFIEDLFIDIGSYSYNRSLEWRNYFRGTQRHNVAFILGKEQNGDLNHKFSLLPLNSSVSCSTREDDNKWEIQSKVKYKTGEVYFRELLYNKQFKSLQIIDSFQNVNDQALGVNFFMHKNILPIQVTNCFELGEFIIKSNTAGECKSAWYSPTYDEKLPINKLSFTKEAKTGYSFEFELAPKN